ncbi:dTDP-4-dehydrorhamnose 3,5-epimerase, partial [Prochlorococcus sp. HOT_208_60]
MEIIKSKIPEVFSLHPKVYNDERGFFLETFRKELAKKIGIPELVQQNQSRSAKGVLRGLHYQQVNPQGKLVRCSNGEIFDVAVDIRKG